MPRKNSVSIIEPGHSLLGVVVEVRFTLINDAQLGGKKHGVGEALHTQAGLHCRKGGALSLDIC